MSNPNSKNRQVQKGNSYFSGATFAHPEYHYWREAWQQIRDAYLGDEEMRRQAHRYIPMLETMDRDEYAAYVQRATFYNMVAKTVNGMHGTLFHRTPKVVGMPKKMDEHLATISREGTSIHAFAHTVAREVVSIGRYGILVDREPEPSNAPAYLTGYLAENIISWTVESIKGKYTLTEVVLREIEMRKTQRFGSHVSYYTNFRVLKLEQLPDSDDYVYVQYFFEASEKEVIADLNSTPSEVTVPTNRGVPFDYIPFYFVGAVENTPGIDKSPILDITKLNISHYQTTAHLEHGRFYTGLPIYFVQTGEGQEKGEYQLGPSTVWEIELGARPGILEFNGTGLSALERALNQKEHQIAALGGRVVGVMSNATAESAEITEMKNKNEASVLMTIAGNISEALTKALITWAKWMDVPEATADKIEFRMSRDFLFSLGTSREFRAIQAMYKDGVIPIEVVYDYLRRSDVIAEDMGLESFKRLLDKPSSFPNQVDILARQEGFPDADTKYEEENKPEPAQTMSQDPAVQAVLATQPPAPATGATQAPG